jgi:hypothetical protein
MKLVTLSLVTSLSLFFSGCSSAPVSVPFKDQSLKQDLSKGFLITPGMTMDATIKIMGRPAKDEYNDNVSEWHYCKTNSVADEFLAIYFIDNKVIAKKNYTVTYADVEAYGSCEIFVKLGNYIEPDKISEYRLKIK